MSIGTIESIIDGLKQVSNDSKKNNSIKNDISMKVTSLLDENPDDDTLKTNIALALVEFYVAKIEGKNEFAFGTKEYYEYEKRLRIWEDIIEKCLRKLELKKLVVLEVEKFTFLQRNLATYFRYCGII